VIVAPYEGIARLGSDNKEKINAGACKNAGACENAETLDKTPALAISPAFSPVRDKTPARVISPIYRRCFIRLESGRKLNACIKLLFFNMHMATARSRPANSALHN
jgi:hypothetical protein